jgi:hypothetical protein
VKKPEGRRPVEKRRRRRVDNINMNLREIGLGIRDWIDLTKDRGRCIAFVSTVMNLRVP